MQVAVRAPASPLTAPRVRARPRVFRGVGPTLGAAITYLSLVVLLPLAGLVAKSGERGATAFWESVTDPRVVPRWSPTGWR